MVMPVFISALLIFSTFLLSCQPVPPATPPAQLPATPPAAPAQPSPPVSQPAAGSAGTSAAWVPDGTITQGEYQKSKSYGDYEINWSADSEFVYIGMKAKTDGWVAVGFGAEQFMKNADILEGYIGDGKAAVADMFSTGEFGPHPADVQQGGTDDILQFGGKREGGTTVIECKRKLDTGDKFDKPLVKGANKIIWAFGADDQSTKKHTVRGAGEIDL